MFVPVACLKCGKPFQVPPAAAGADVPCPWCKETTPALPVVLPPATAATAPATQAPAPLPPPPGPQTPPPPAPGQGAPPAPPAAAASFPWVTLVVVLLVSGVVGGGTYLVMRWLKPPAAPETGTPDTPKGVPLAAAAWATFTAGDQTWSAELPGRPTEEPLPAGVGGTGRRVVVRDAAAGWAAWVGWRDLDAEWAGRARSKGVTKEGSDHPRFLLGPVFDAERKRVQAEWGVTDRRSRTLWEPRLAVEVEMGGEPVRLIERMVVAPDSPRPRIYLVGLAAPDLDPAGPAARRLLESFRIK